MNRIKIMEQIDKAINDNKININKIDLYSIVKLIYNYNDSVSHLYYDNMEDFDELMGGITPSTLLELINNSPTDIDYYDDYFRVEDYALETITESSYNDLLKDNIIEILFNLIVNDEGIWKEFIEDAGYYMDEDSFNSLNIIRNNIDK